MAITRFDPLSEALQVQRSLNRLFDTQLEIFGLRHEIPVDIFEMTDKYLVEASLPGVQPEELKVTATATTLVIHAEESMERKVTRHGTFLRQERMSGEMTRTITFPMRIDPDGVTSIYEHGVLKLDVPKAEVVKTRHIEVRTKEVLKEPQDKAVKKETVVTR